MGFDAFGAPQFGLNDVQVATWNSAGNYGDEVDIPSAQMMGATLQQVSAQLEGDDAVTASASRAIGGTVQIRFGSISLAALEVLVGSTITSSLSTPNVTKSMKIDGGQNMPYFGICGKALAEEGDGDTHVFIPKAKIMGDFQIAMLEYGRFAIPEVTAQYVKDTTHGLIKIIEHETAVAVAIPPLNIAS
jgi:hypothetical protein